MKSYVGLDVHSKSSYFVIQDGRGREVGRGEIPTTPDGLASLRKRYRLAAGTQVALETGTVAFYAARRLAELQLAPVVVDAREVRLKAHRPEQKSDSKDAAELCEGVRRGIYRSIIHVPPAAIELLRQTLSRRRHFVRARTSEVNAAKRLVRGAGLSELARRTLKSARGWGKLVEALKSHDDLAGFIRIHRAAWETAERQISSLEESLRKQGASYEADLSRVRTVPGVGEIVGLTAIAVFSDVTRFESAKHASSYAGVVPRTWQSGDRNQQGRITKNGSAELRAMLVEAAHQARRRDNPFSPYLRNLTVRAGYKKAVIAVAHRLCRILFAILRDKTDFDPSKLGVEKGAFEVTTTRVYRLKRAATTSG